MKKLITTGLISLMLLQSPIAANAAKFKNCTAVNAKYPGGVSISIDVQNQGGKTKQAPKVDAKLYKLIKFLDRDKDGIACER